MRHHRAGRKLGRDSAHRKALYANLACALIEHGRIKTTEAKAKEVRPIVEQMITLGKRGDVAAQRQAVAFLRSKSIAHTLFADVAPRFAARPGGYTRLLRLGFRRGDSAEVAQVELVGSEFNPRAKDADTKGEGEKPKAKGVRERLRAAAERVRGKKGDDTASAKPSTKPSKGVTRKSTTPRKAGGS
jgi:large subunit ribosomal protein L17